MTDYYRSFNNLKPIDADGEPESERLIADGKYANGNQTKSYDDLENNVVGRLNIKEAIGASTQMLCCTPPGDDKVIEPHLFAKNGDVSGFRNEAVKHAPELVKRFLNRTSQKETDDAPPLHYAVRHGHIEIIKVFLGYGADVNICNKDGQTALHLAAKYRPAALSGYSKPLSARGSRMSSPAVRRRKPKMTRSLMAYGAEHLPFHEERREETIISVLIANGAHVDAVDNFTHTPLHYAAVKDNKEEAKQLIESNAKVNADDFHKSSPLHQAASHGSESVAELLVRSGAMVRSTDEKRNTPLHLACRHGHEKVVRILLNKIPRSQRKEYIEQRNFEDNNALHLAALGGHLDVIQEIFDDGINFDVNVCRKDKMTLLHLAVQKGNEQLCRKLIDMGANVRAEEGSNKRTPLDFAAYHNQPNIIELLIQYDADVECRTSDGFTPFLTAVSENNLEAVEELCENECDRSVVDVAQRSAIFLAAKFQGIAILEFLLEDGDETFLREYVNKPNIDFQSPLHVAAANNYMDILIILKENGANIKAAGDDEETPLHLACENNHVEVAAQLLEWDETQINDPDENGNTPLHYAAREGNIEVLNLLIENGADVLARNDREMTPLDVAVQGNHRECVEELILAKAPLEPAQNNVTTALHIAAEEGHDELISLLLDDGITIDRVNENGKSALDIAVNAKKDNSKVAKSLLKNPEWRSLMRASKGADDKHKHKNKLPCSAMCQIIRDMPDIAKIVFDKCMEPKQDEYGHKVIEMDYEFINDSYTLKSVVEKDGKTPNNPYDQNGKLKKEAVLKDSNYDSVIATHPLQIMVESERIDLLKHKLVASLIRHKWNTYARYVYYSALFIYIVFLAAFTVYVTNTQAPYEVIDINRTWEVTGTLDETECERINDRRPFFLNLCRLLAMALAIGQLLKEIYQLLNRWWRYFNSENCFEVSLYVGAFLVCADLNPCAYATGIRSPWQWMLAGVVIFCAWINLILLIRKIPRFGIYVVMVVNTIKTFYRFSLIFALFIIAFSSGFFVVLQNKPEFSSYMPSFVKTTVMMIGEFEYTAIFYEVEEEDKHQSHLFGRPIAHAIFMVFMVVMNVILMNLLVGLAVDDIKGVLERAELMRLRMQVETIFDIERALPDWFRRHAHRGKEILYVDRKKPQFDKSFFTNCWRYMGYTHSDIEELQEEYEDSETVNMVISNQNRNMRLIEAATKAVREVGESMKFSEDRIDMLQDKMDRIEKLLTQLVDTKAVKAGEVDVKE